MVWAWMLLKWLRKHVVGLGSLKKPALKCTIPICIYIYDGMRVVQQENVGLFRLDHATVPRGGGLRGMKGLCRLPKAR